MVTNLKKLFHLGIYDGMPLGLRTAILITNFDVWATSLILLGYFINALVRGEATYSYFFGTSFVLCLVSGYLLHKKFLDVGRFLLQTVGVSSIYIYVDSMGFNSGYDYYYFTSVACPFIIFDSEEMIKGLIAAGMGFVAFIVQQQIGTGLIFDSDFMVRDDRLSVSIIVILYLVVIFGAARWQMGKAHKKIQEQQTDLIQAANMSAIGQLSAGLSHEINNPLQIITGNIYFLKRAHQGIQNLPAEIPKRLEVIEKNYDRIADIVNSLRKISTRSIDKDGRKFTLKEAFDDLLRLNYQRLEDLNVSFAIEGDQEISLKGDITQFSQVFLHLMNNSLDAIAGLKEKWIRLEIHHNDGTITISHVDSGKGISSEIISKMMQPFFTTKEPGKGTGLGLSVSASILERMGGKMNYLKTASNTTFLVILPKVN